MLRTIIFNQNLIGRYLSTATVRHDVYREQLRHHVDSDPLFQEFIRKQLGGDPVSETTEQALQVAAILQMSKRLCLTGVLTGISGIILCQTSVLALASLFMDDGASLAAMVGVGGISAITAGKSIPLTSRAIANWRRLRQIGKETDRAMKPPTTPLQL